VSTEKVAIILRKPDGKRQKPPYLFSKRDLH
jgi:hypothetical protein